MDHAIEMAHTCGFYSPLFLLLFLYFLCEFSDEIGERRLSHANLPALERRFISLISFPLILFCIRA